MKKESFSVLPQRGMLSAIASQKCTWRTVLEEWIDNAIDAKAKNIEVTIVRGKSGSVMCKDDGLGCSDLSRFFILGKHERDEGRGTIGRHGIGSKDASLWIAGADGKIRVRSVHDGVARYISTSWKDIGESWSNDRSLQCDVSKAAPAETGTYIHAQPVVHRVPDGKQYTQLLKDLSYTYWPAIQNGVAIKVVNKAARGEPRVDALDKWMPPKRLSVPRVTGTVVVGGKSARLDIGVLDSGARTRYPGISYIHDGRVIVQNGGRGCGSHSFSRIYGVVHLDKEWRLTKNKEDVIDAEALHGEVERLCSEHDVFRIAAKAGISIETEALLSALDSLINPADDAKTKGKPDKKAKRRPPENQSGTVEPTGTGPKHKQAGRTQPGDTFGGKTKKRKRARAKIEVVFEPFGDSDQMARVNGPLVTFNLDHGFVMKAKATSDHNALAALVFAYIATDDVRRPGSAKANGRPPALSLSEFDTLHADVIFDRIMAKLAGHAYSIDGNEAADAK